MSGPAPTNETVIAGRYELGRRLGQGERSTVYLSHDRRLDRSVALRVLAEDLADDAQFVSRFKREALSAARLVHPNIVQVFDFGVDQASGRYYIVMEYIRGRSGAEILREEVRLGVSDTLQLVDGACRGLAHAHRMGIVHGNLMPTNILWSDKRETKVGGIGAVTEGLSSIAPPASASRIASCPPPERLSGGELGPLADIFGLGVITYHLLAGRPPFEVTAMPEHLGLELLRLQRQSYPVRLDEIAEVPRALAVVIERALMFEPALRYGSVEELRRALALGARGVMPPELPPGTAPNRRPTTAPGTRSGTLATALASTRRRRRKSRTPADAPLAHEEPDGLVDGRGYPVFISYRREETAAEAGRLFDWLDGQLGAGTVFMDHALDPGIDFAKEVEQLAATCRVFLVVIGPRWASVQDDDGERRLFDARDLLRLEIEAALRQPAVRVIPLLVQGATMPKARDIPETLAALLGRHSVTLTHSAWRRDAEQLTTQIGRILRP